MPRGARKQDAVDGASLLLAALANMSRRERRSFARLPLCRELLELLQAAQFEAICDRASLTSRERDVATSVLLGLGNRQVAGELGISEATISVHLTRIFVKTATDSRTELMALFLGRKQGNEEGGPR